MVRPCGACWKNKRMFTVVDLPTYFLAFLSDFTLLEIVGLQNYPSPLRVRFFKNPKTDLGTLYLTGQLIRDHSEHNSFKVREESTLGKDSKSVDLMRQ